MYRWERCSERLLRGIDSLVLSFALTFQVLGKYAQAIPVIHLQYYASILSDHFHHEARVPRVWRDWCLHHSGNRWRKSLSVMARYPTRYSLGKLPTFSSTCPKLTVNWVVLACHLLHHPH